MDTEKKITRDIEERAKAGTVSAAIETVAGIDNSQCRRALLLVATDISHTATGELLGVARETVSRWVGMHKTELASLRANTEEYTKQMYKHTTTLMMDTGLRLAAGMIAKPKSVSVANWSALVRGMESLGRIITPTDTPDNGQGYAKARASKADAIAALKQVKALQTGQK